jgi:hypothetical protein
MPRPTAAEALFPHLPHQSDYAAKQQDKTTVAQAMYPALTQRAKARDDWRDRDRQSLLKALREANAAADARLAREGRR